jgi:predicted metalloendopeptidase
VLQGGDVLFKQYSRFLVLPGLMSNGSMTLTKNTADLGDIALAHAELQRQSRPIMQSVKISHIRVSPLF